MKFLSAKSDALCNTLKSELERYRYKVFVETLGWDLPSREGRETDQFDHDDTYYVIARDEEGRINGCARLLPTDRQYLLGEIFPQLMAGQAPPRHHDIWELSRFTSMDLHDNRNTLEDTFRLLRKAIATAATLGARRIISVSPVGIERLLRQGGFATERAGPPMRVNGHLLYACWIDIPVLERPIRALPARLWRILNARSAATPRAQIAGAA
ncbi:GNAT family N-acetyltransferase [Janthinobacterium sp. FT14W]|uniref:acyl-homoserine-lactone synthase n=1 Tax=Janthinobacterium sp. FT14W TaxID=2654253 RepID=UPI001264B441|nr:acyl-homoserine-lactone synthase [Janthinobacterium sp. FT14W]KAB8059217.1 GNAT family N-acetyltransferase [Janthinobacterium sp. FT14W]